MRLAAALLAAAYVAFTPSLSLAQGDGENKKPGRDAGEAREQMTPAQHAEKMVEGMEKTLKLTPDQKNKIKPLVEKAAAERKEMHEKMLKADRENSEKIRALLNDEQKEKYDLMRAKRKMMGQEMGRRMRGKMGRKHGERGERGGEGGHGEGDDGPGEHEGPEGREGQDGPPHD